MRLGFGAAASVYKCHDEKLNRVVAVKTLNLVGGSQIIDFQREARALSTLQHEAIVRILDFGVTAKGAPYLVMDFVEGKTLADRLADSGPLPMNEALDLFAKVGEGLSHAHEKGIFHRDIKPSNILISDDGETQSVTIVDFGIAQMDQQPGSQIAAQGQTIVGTPFYMSPDQLRGEKYDAASEVYSLSCILFEALTGHAPFHGDSPLELLSQHASIPPPSIRDFGHANNLTPELEMIVRKGLEKSKEKRYRSMSEPISALNAVAMYNTALESATTNDTTPRHELRNVNRRYAIAFTGGLLAVAAVIPVIAFNTLNQVEKKRTPKMTLNLPVDFGSLNEIGDDMDKQAVSISNNYCRINGVEGEMDTALFRRVTRGHTIKRLLIMGVYPTAEDAVLINSLKLDRLDLVQSRCTDDVMKLLSESDMTALVTKYTVLSNDVLKYIGQMESLKYLDMTKPDITEKAIAQLANAKHLTEIRLVSAELVTGEGLAELKQLISLDISNTTITRPVLTTICSLPQLRALKISPTNLSDDDLTLLIKTKLAGLRLGGDKITGKGIAALSKIPHLEQIELNELPLVTESDITNFRKARPDVRVMIKLRERSN
ncbi:MAG: protein kinase [Candidatus Obscuribacterales bacterium]|nr:protein kinase [Candidatus Obscuribacterales bacterium]